jgi:glutaredoxin
MIAEPLVVYSRDGCHLCDVMEEALVRRGVAFVKVDVDSDPRIRERFGHLVPVLAAGEREICRYRIDEGALERYLSAS